MNLADGVRRLKVRTNAETPEDAAKARAFGAEGIGLFRTEHMFYGEGADEPLFLLRKMIMSGDEDARRAALEELHEMNPMMGHRGVRLGITFGMGFQARVQWIEIRHQVFVYQPGCSRIEHLEDHELRQPPVIPSTTRLASRLQ